MAKGIRAWLRRARSLARRLFRHHGGISDSFGAPCRAPRPGPSAGAWHRAVGHWLLPGRRKHRARRAGARPVLRRPRLEHAAPAGLLADGARVRPRALHEGERPLHFLRRPREDVVPRHRIAVAACAAMATGARAVWHSWTRRGARHLCRDTAVSRTERDRAWRPRKRRQTRIRRALDRV